MNLPRIVITVTGHAPSGWDVHVGGVGMHRVDATKITADGTAKLVPVDGGVDIESLLRRLAARAPEPGDVRTYGRWLFESLLSPAWPTIRRYRAFELALDLPLDLQHLCWEAMHDGVAPLAGHPDLLVAFTRLVDSSADPPQTLTRIPRVLFAVGANPNDEVIRPGAMMAGLLRAFDSGMVRTSSEVSLEKLAEICRDFRPDIVHLVAHGGLDEDGRGLVRLPDSVEGVGADRLLPALTAGGTPLAVLLSACFSGQAVPGTTSLAAELVAGGIPVVSAMSGEVSEQACRLFTRRFVHAVSGGLPAAKAVAQGRRAALLVPSGPGEHLDWAMPTLFVARSAEPGFQLVDPAEPRKVMQLANQLGLRKHPVFIGRDDILQRLPDLFLPDPDRSLGFIGLNREGSLSRLGGPRLLREIGLTLLRAGHIPLFLGPYDDRNAPVSIRACIAEIISRAVKVATIQEARLPQFSLLGGAGPDYEDVLTALREFREDCHELDRDIARLRLSRDLAAFISAMGDSGPPFGSQTRAVVLADSLHAWAGVVDDLLPMIDASGLGTARDPVPVIATYSLTAGMGPRLKAFTECHVGPGFAFPPLGPLTDAEAILGFQWVLLHPWKPEYRNVYVCRDAEREQVSGDLRILDGLPDAVERDLYLLAQLLERHGFLVSADDDAVYQQYESKYP